MPDEPAPWYRTSGAIVAAGGVGLVLVIALVVAVVQMSDQWSVTPTPTYTPATFATTTATPRSELTTTPTTTATTYPTVVAVDDGYQSVDHTAVQFGDVEFGDVEFGDVEFGDHLTHSGDRGRRAHNEDAEANTSNQHHAHAIPASDQLTL